MSEKEIEHSIVDYLRSLDVHCWPVNTVGIFDPTTKRFRHPGKRHVNGVSDILACIQGRMVAIEVKSKIGRVSPEQRIFITRTNEEGGVAFVARSVEQVRDELIKHFPQLFGKH